MPGQNQQPLQPTSDDIHRKIDKYILMVIILTGTIFQPFKRIFVQQQAPSATLPPLGNSNQRTDFYDWHILSTCG